MSFSSLNAAKLAALSCMLVAATQTSAAIISDRDFDTLTLGNLGTDTTGVTPGQDGWYTFGGANSNYQIVNDPQIGGTRNRNLRITGPSTSSTATRFAWNDDILNSWNSSTDQEIVLTFDQYVVAPTALQTSTALNRGGVRIFNEAGNTLVGMQIQANTGALQLITYANPNDGVSAIGNYAFNLTDGAGAPVIASRSAWHSFALIWNKISGDATLLWDLDTTPGFESGVFIAGSPAAPGDLFAAAAGTNPLEYDAVVSRNNASVGTNFHYDNFLAETFIPEPASLSLLALPALAMVRRRK
jgi:hypothetical protein